MAIDRLIIVVQFLLMIGLPPLTTPVPLRLSCKTYAHFSIHLEGLYYSGSILKEITHVATRRKCILQCVSFAKCLSVNYNFAAKICQLLEAPFVQNTAGQLVSKEGWVFMSTDDTQRNVGEFCSAYSPCKNGKCIDTCTSEKYKCKCDPFYYGKHCNNIIQDCKSVYKSGLTQNGVYTIFLAQSQTKMQVYCDMTTGDGRWIVFQRRADSSVSFYQNWASYKNGFGSLTANFWLGLDKLHLIAGPNRRAILRVEVKHRVLGSTLYYAQYSYFEIRNEAEKYKLFVSGYSGNAGDSLAYHNEMGFSTFDRDNDLAASENCASHWSGAWWYNHCHHSNLNGLFPSSNTVGANYMTWYHLRSEFGNIFYSVMKIKFKSL